MVAVQTFIWYITKVKEICPSFESVINSDVTIDGACSWIPVTDGTMSYCPSNDQVVTAYCDSTGTSCMGGSALAAMKCCSVTGLIVDTTSCLQEGGSNSDEMGDCRNTAFGYYGLVNGICGTSGSGVCSGSFKHEVRHQSFTKKTI